MERWIYFHRLPPVLTLFQMKFIFKNGGREIFSFSLECLSSFPCYICINKSYIYGLYQICYFGMAVQEAKRPEKLWRTIFMLCEDIQDMDLEQAPQSLMALFVERINKFFADITDFIKIQVDK